MSDTPEQDTFDKPSIMRRLHQMHFESIDRGKHDMESTQWLLNQVYVLAKSGDAEGATIAARLLAGELYDHHNTLDDMQLDVLHVVR
jgi:hypothetical protein